jgi:hypothetical protein
MNIKEELGFIWEGLKFMILLVSVGLAFFGLLFLIVKVNYVAYAVVAILVFVLARFIGRDLKPPVIDNDNNDIF